MSGFLSKSVDQSQQQTHQYQPQQSDQRPYSPLQDAEEEFSTDVADEELQAPQSEDDDLDNALEEELAASFHRHSYNHPPSAKPPPAKALFNPSVSKSSLTFAFPGWGVDIFRDPKRRKPSIVRHELDTYAQQGEQLSINAEKEEPRVSWGDADTPGNGNSVYKMPNEILTNVLKRLGIRDLCSAIRTCHWWQHLGSQDEVWGQFDAQSNVKQAVVSLPKWGIVKNNALSARVQKRVASKYAYFWKGFVHLRSALHAWWETGRPSDPYNSKSIGGLIRKMTIHDWTLLYEFFGAAFAERADCIAVTLIREVEKEADKISQPLCPFRCNHNSCTLELDSITSNQDLRNILSKTPLDFVLIAEDQGLHEGLVGRSIWKIVDQFWKRYKNWLMVIFEHCLDLNREVMVEKVRTTSRSTTPSIYEKGVICFRSQILLKYGLRRVLQSGFASLSAHDANGLASEFDVELLKSIYHLLQEMDVHDDALSPTSFTQAKLRRCFPIKRAYMRHDLDEMENKFS